MYIAEDDPQVLVVQDKTLDDDTIGNLQDHAPDETAVRIPAETVLRAVARYAAECAQE